MLPAEVDDLRAMTEDGLLRLVIGHRVLLHQAGRSGLDLGYQRLQFAGSFWVLLKQIFEPGPPDDFLSIRDDAGDWPIHRRAVEAD